MGTLPWALMMFFDDIHGVEQLGRCTRCTSGFDNAHVSTGQGLRNKRLDHRHVPGISFLRYCLPSRPTDARCEYLECC